MFAGTGGAAADAASYWLRVGRIERLGGNAEAYRKLLLKFAENQGDAMSQIKDGQMIEIDGNWS